VDFQFPNLFDLEFIGEDGARHRPFMIHRALFGSIERFFAILLEHYGGAFPTWLAADQVTVVPISDRHYDYAEQVAEHLREHKVRVTVDSSDQSLGNRVRKAQVSKVPYMLVVGDKEVEARTLSVKPRGGNEKRGVPLDEFTANIVKEVDERLISPS
jgi:threonyl-tRNA synthetase